jgi:glutamyl/glutaminyl-tRNA synthetase
VDQTHCVTNKNMIESNAELAEFLKKKLAAMNSEYILERDSPTFTPKTLKLMKNKMTPAKNNRMLSSVFKASPTSRIERERIRRSLYTFSKIVFIWARLISPVLSLSKTWNASSAKLRDGNAG